VVVTARLSGNRKPVADAGDDITGILVGQEVHLDGSGSSDPEGSDLTYTWSQVSGPAVELTDKDTARPGFIPDQAGTYTFELVVNDGDLDSDPDQVSVQVKENSNKKPVADAGEDITGILVGHEVHLDGRGSHDPEGSDLTYAWSQVSGPAVELTDKDTARPGFIPDQAGTYTFELVVNDGDQILTRYRYRCSRRARRPETKAVVAELRAAVKAGCPCCCYSWPLLFTEQGKNRDTGILSRASPPFSPPEPPHPG